MKARLCRCKGACPLWERVALAVRQNDEDGPGYRRLKEARAAWLDHVLAEAPCLDAVRLKAAA